MSRKLLRLALAAHVVAAAMSGQQIYDLLLKNGHVIDPANKRNGRFDIAIVGDKIARVGTDLPAAHARVVVEAAAGEGRKAAVEPRKPMMFALPAATPKRQSRRAGQSMRRANARNTALIHNSASRIAAPAWAYRTGATGTQRSG